MNEGLKRTLDEARSTLEDLRECGDLEDQLTAAQFVADLETLLAAKTALGVPAEWLPCGFCRGTGKSMDYEDEYPCSPCGGEGGSWI